MFPIDQALALGELGMRNVPLNFLNPIPDTPLENRKQLRPEEALRIIALYRFLLPRAAIPVCSQRCLPNILSISMPGADGLSIQFGLDLRGIQVSLGSACAPGSPETSHVLRAIGISADLVQAPSGSAWEGGTPVPRFGRSAK
jgi:hypothetical protein